jgi:hypothetical protein
LERDGAVREALAVRAEEAADAVEAARRECEGRAARELEAAMARRDAEHETAMATVLDLTKSAMRAKDAALSAGVESAEDKIAMVAASSDAEHRAKVATMEASASRSSEMVTRLQSALDAQQVLTSAFSFFYLLPTHPLLVAALNDLLVTCIFY